MNYCFVKLNHHAEPNHPAKYGGPGVRSLKVSFFRINELSSPFKGQNQFINKNLSNSYLWRFFSEKILLRAHQEFGVKTWLRLGYGDGVLEKIDGKNPKSIFPLNFGVSLGSFCPDLTKSEENIKI